RTFRGPMISPSHPLGISKMAYASVNALKIHPIWTAVRCKSSRMEVAAVAIQTLSRYVITDKANANRSNVKRARDGTMSGVYYGVGDRPEVKRPPRSASPCGA